MLNLHNDIPKRLCNNHVYHMYQNMISKAIFSVNLSEQNTNNCLDGKRKRMKFDSVL